LLAFAASIYLLELLRSVQNYEMASDMAALLVKLTAAGTSDGDRKETAQQVADLVKEAGITILKVMLICHLNTIGHDGIFAVNPSLNPCGCFNLFGQA
jgi:hypothetical protein